MTEPDLHTSTGAYVADALDPAERRDFEAHLQECDACRQEVAELSATVSRLAVAAQAPPPPGMREHVLAEVARTRQLPPAVADDGRDGAAVVPLRPRWWQQPAAVAAALLLVVAAGAGAFGIAQQRRADRAEQRADRIAAIVTAPDRVEDSAAAASGEGGGTVVAADGAAVVRMTGLSSLPSDRTYQLWLISDGQPRSAGLLGSTGDAQTVLDDVTGVDALGVTVEPAGGSSAPTSDIVLQLDIAS